MTDAVEGPEPLTRLYHPMYRGWVDVPADEAAGWGDVGWSATPPPGHEDLADEA